MPYTLMTEKDKKTEEKRDEELDIAKATEIAREFIRSNVGNLLSSQFRLENVRQNGSKTRYIIICSIIPDIGKERDYYLIKLDIKTGELIPPLGRGKLENGEIRFKEMKVDDPKWLE